MKKYVSIFSLVVFNVFILKAQSINIQEPDKACKGEEVRFAAELTNIAKPLRIIWSIGDDINFVGNVFTYTFPLDSDEDVVELECQVFYDDGGATQFLTKKVNVQFSNKVTIEEDLSHFIKDKSLYIEVKNSDDANFTYQLKSPSGDSRNGTTVRFEDVSDKSFGEYSLKKVSKASTCSAEKKIVIKKAETDKGKEVFGTISKNEIEGNLYKEVKRDIAVQECTIGGRIIDDNMQIAYPGYQFTIIAELNDRYIIRFWKRGEPRKKKSPTSGNIITKVIGDMTVKCHVQDLPDNSYRIQGKLTRNDDVLTGVNIIEKSTANRTITDEEGKFSLITKSKDLEIARGGYESNMVQLEDPGESTESLDKDQFDLTGKHGIYNSKFVYKFESDDDLNSYRYFSVSKSAIDFRTIPFTKSGGLFFTAGTVILPVKLRDNARKGLNNFEFSKDITLGPFVGLQMRTSKYKPHFINLGLTVGISSVRLTSINSRIEKPVEDVAAFSTALGLVFEINNVQMGCFWGYDFINNNKDIGDSKIGVDWAYQGKSWFSIGFGYSLISRPSQGDVNREGGNFK